MRNSLALLGGLAFVAAFTLPGTAAVAHENAGYGPTYEYVVVNPVEMGNTRDDRDSVPETDNSVHAIGYNSITPPDVDRRCNINGGTCSNYYEAPSHYAR